MGTFQKKNEGATTDITVETTATEEMITLGA